MLPKSRKPQIIRLHQLQQTERNKYINEFCNAGQEWLPNNLWSFLPILADIYYTYTTICLCRRRLGEQYTYVAMYNQKHYYEQGVLVNANTRTVMFVLQIMQRHLIKRLIQKIMAKLQSKTEGNKKWSALSEILSLRADGIMQEGRLFMLMLFLLGWNQHFNLIDTILRNQYIYTYFNKSNAVVDYRIQGYMLLVVFCVKLFKFLVKLYRGFQKPGNKMQKEKHKINEGEQTVKEQQKQQQQQEQLCRICYDNISNKSVTNCGHTFCWKCIMKYLNTNPECPVCRTACEAKQIVQLQNY